uniref:Uncharacterized protein n=1 Tax=Anguilla anguilla TaxID=7936 RepID=A0A0E9X2W8_ANGAN
MFGITVLLRSPIMLQLQFMDRRPDILFTNFLAQSRNHGSLNNGKLSSSRGSKASPHHHTTNTMFDCWYVCRAKSCICFTPRLCRPKSSNFYIFVHRTLSQKVGGSSRCFFQL